MSRNLESRVEQLEKLRAVDESSGPTMIFLVPLEPRNYSALANDFTGVLINGVFHALPAGEEIRTFEARLMAEAARETASEIGRVSLGTLERVRRPKATDGKSAESALDDVKCGDTEEFGPPIK